MPFFNKEKFTKFLEQAIGYPEKHFLCLEDTTYLIEDNPHMDVIKVTDEGFIITKPKRVDQYQFRNERKLKDGTYLVKDIVSIISVLDSKVTEEIKDYYKDYLISTFKVMWSGDVLFSPSEIIDEVEVVINTIYDVISFNMKMNMSHPKTEYLMYTNACSNKLDVHSFTHSVTAYAIEDAVDFILSSRG